MAARMSAVDRAAPIFQSLPSMRILEPCTRLDTQRNVDTCKFANYKGKLLYESDYTTCENQPPVPDDGLRLRSENQATVRVFLQDGTMLIPVDLCNPRKRSANPLNTLPLVN
jgi:hypothetical protein